MSNCRIKSEQNYKLKNILDDIDNNNNQSNSFFNKFIKSTKREMITNENISPEDNTTERKKIDVVKDSIDNNELNDTSVDMKTNYGEENINIKTNYNFNSHNSGLKTLSNSKIDISTSKEIKIPQESISRDIFQISIKKDENFEESPLKEIDDGKKNIFLSKNELLENKKEEEDYYNDTINYNYDFYFGFNERNILNYKELYFREMMIYKEREFRKDYELMRGNGIFRTTVIYNEKECILLLNKKFLYILEFKSKLKEDMQNHDKEDKNKKNNPELSLLEQLQKEELINNSNNNNDNKNILKIDYDLSHPLLCLNFNLLSCKLLLNKKNNNKNNKKYEIQILILGTSTKFSFFIKNYEIYKRFIYELGSIIYNSEGYKANKLGLSLRTKHFYSDTYISLSFFDSIVKTGDLLLFRSLECISDCQRFFTRDQYDHIANIVIMDGKIYLFESTINENCNLQEWRLFKFNLYNLVFKKVVLRRLNIEEENPIKLKEIRNSIDEKSIEFVQKIKKKKYNMSILKIVFGSKPSEYEVKGEWEKAEGFCCSALAAAFYLYNGVMKLEKSVHCTRPGDFEQDKNRLCIQPGFSFGPEKILEFST